MQDFRVKELECVAARPYLWVLKLVSHDREHSQESPKEIRLVVSKHEAIQLASIIGKKTTNPLSWPLVMQKALDFFDGEFGTMFVENKYNDWRIVEVLITNPNKECEEYSTFIKANIIDAIMMTISQQEYQHIIIADEVVEIIEREYEVLVGAPNLAQYDISRISSESDSVLKMMLERAIKEELYELASKIRDELNKRKQ